MLLKRLTYPRKLKKNPCHQCDDVKAWAEEIIARQEQHIKDLAQEKKALYQLFYKIAKHSLPGLYKRIYNDDKLAAKIVEIFNDLPLTN